MLPGDWLEWECTYDTSRAVQPVVGGYDSRRNEMCVFNLHYAP